MLSHEHGLTPWTRLGVPVALTLITGLLLQFVPLVPIGFVVATLAVLLALNAPRTTIALTILLGQVLQFEIAPLLAIPPEGLALGAINLRLSDPLVLGMVGAIVIRLLKRDYSLFRFLRHEGALWFVLIVYLVLHVAADIGTYGASAPGEFRTYFQFLLFVPYIVMSTKTNEERRDLFFLLLFLSLSQLLSGLLRAYFLFGMTFGAYEKWLSGFGSLALLYGLYAYGAAAREHLLPHNGIFRFAIYAGSVAMILVAGARAVWLAGACGLLFVMLRRQLSVRKVALAVVLALVTALAVSPLFFQSGLYLGDFIRERLLAFTDFTADPTAAWRYVSWHASLEQILKNPILGHGFGLHFDIFIPEFREVLTTSPHNLYLSILYQAGVVGLSLYLIWILLIFARFWKASSPDAAERAIHATALMVIISVHAYGIAYSFEKDFFTWSYIGLGFSSLIHMQKSGDPPVNTQ